MGILGGMDLGHGSQLKLIRTNFLCVRPNDNNNKSQQFSNMLQLINDRLPKALKCDYIMLAHGPNIFNTQAPIDVPTGNRPQTVEHSTVTYGYGSNSEGFFHGANVSIMGPSAQSLAARSDAGTYADSVNDVQGKSSGKVLGLTGISAFPLRIIASTDSLSAIGSIALDAGVDNSYVLDIMNSNMLVKQMQEGSAAPSIDLREAIGEIIGSLDAYDFRQDRLNENFVPAGSTTGTPTTLTSLDEGTTGAQSIDLKRFVILSVTAIVRDAQ